MKKFESVRINVRAKKQTFWSSWLLDWKVLESNKKRNL